VANTVRGPGPQSIRTPARRPAQPAHARHFHGDPTVGRRHEQATTRIVASHSQFEEVRTQLRAVQRRLEQANVQADADANAARRHFGAGHIPPQVKPAAVDKPVAKRGGFLRDRLEHNLLRLSAVLFMIGAVGWCLLITNQFRTPALVASAGAAIGKADLGLDRTDPARSSSHVRIDSASAAALRDWPLAGGESPAHIVADEWNLLGEQRQQKRVAERPKTPAPATVKQAVKDAVKPVAKEAKLSVKPPVRLASLDNAEPEVPQIPSRMPARVDTLTRLVDFESAPFPYHGVVPGSGRAFLNSGSHTSFRGKTLWESQTFSDDRVLLHIPSGFDPSRPAVMVVFFHGHGAILGRDVRDRQQVPEQITAAGANAVLVAPQFAVDAADSSAGKFWEPNGFKRFLDEAAIKLAYMYGDPRSQAAFAKMPIVLVAYSGGFGPTLSVLDRGGVRSRIHGLVLLDALYAGIDKFADWIADNRSAFFISSYTPHTAHHNADLQRLLRERAVAYGSDLRRAHLQGTVTFLPAGPVSHRDFVTHAWSDNPIKDVLARMDDVDPRVQTAGTTASIPPARN
jgi:hypothetical protein